MPEAHIIIAEDEPNTRLSLDILLRRAGYQVTMVPDGCKAYEFIRESSDADLLLTDIQMPGMNGLDLIRGLKERDMHIPVIVFTGFGDKETIVELLREGCQEYIDKPFREEDLLKKIHKVLEKSRSEKSKITEREKEIREFKKVLDSYKINCKELEKSVNSAVDTCRNILDPEINLKSSRVKTAYRFQTVDKLGGDYAEIADIGCGCDILLADVAGHDLGASYHTIVLKTLFEENCRLGHVGEDFMQVVNWALYNYGNNEKMAAAIFIRIDIIRGEVHVISAGHPYLLRFKANSPNSVLRPLSPKSGFVLGLIEEPEFETRTFGVGPGDRIIIYTDGVPNCSRIDQSTGLRVKLGNSGLREMLKKNFDGSIEDMIGKTWDDVNAYCKNKIFDDMLLIGIEMPQSVPKI